MKKIIQFAAFACIAVLFSCKSKNQSYSCNPALNSYVAQNLSRFETFDRDSLVSIDSISMQHAIYNALCSSQKYSVWTSKLDLVLQTYGLSPAENDYILSAKARLQPTSWNSDDSIFALESWAMNWAKTAMQTFHWDSTKLYIIAGTYLTINEINTLRQKYVGDGADIRNYTGSKNTNWSAMPISGGVPDCACRYSASCWFYSQSCGGKCNSTYGCGVFGTSRCTGTCQDISTMPVGTPSTTF